MCLNAMTGALTVLYSNSSVQPIPDFGIGNRNDGPISVSEPNLFFPKPKPLFWTNFGQIFLIPTFDILSIWISGHYRIYNLGTRLNIRIFLGILPTLDQFPQRLIAKNCKRWETTCPDNFWHLVESSDQKLFLQRK